MKQKRIFFLLSLIAFMAITMNGFAQEHPDYDAVADKIVNYALEVKPGETVIITGTPAEMDLLSSLVVAVYKAGGKPTIEVSIPEAEKKALMESPMEYLEITPKYEIAKLQFIDCFINTGSIQDPKLYSDVPEERLAANRKAFKPVNEAYNKANYRSVGLGQTGGIPTKVYAEYKGIKYEDMLSMFWKSVSTDYDKMLDTGKKLSGMIKPNSMIKVNSEAGTNLTFKISDIPVRINCGRTAENISTSGPAQTWLPAGEIYACIDPSSASGVMVVPSMTFRGKGIKNLKLTFANGRITDIKADENGELIQKSFEMSTGDKDVFSLIDIGINSESKPLEGSDYYSWEMGGMVTAHIGNNSWAGGNVEADNGMSFHLANTTLSIDNKTIVKNGQLNLAETK